MTSLFNLTGDYLKIKELAEQGADPEAIEDAIAYIDDEIEDKADGYAYIIRQLDGNKEAIDKEIKRRSEERRVGKEWRARAVRTAWHGGSAGKNAGRAMKE